MNKRTTNPDAYRCYCGGKVVKAIFLDTEGLHEMEYLCRTCGCRHGETWEVRLWGKSDPTPVLNLPPWSDTPLSITQELLRPRPHAVTAELLKFGAAGLAAYIIVSAMMNLPHLNAASILGSILI